MTNGISAITVVLAEIVESAISLTDLERIVSHRRAGAVVSFVGAVRDHDHGRSVIDLQYEAHPNAGAVLEQVAQEVCDRPLLRPHRGGSSSSRVPPATEAVRRSGAPGPSGVGPRPSRARGGRAGRAGPSARRRRRPAAGHSGPRDAG